MSPHAFLSKGMVSYTSYLGVEGISLYRQNGCLYWDSAVRWTDITDGTSNTLLIGERPAASYTITFGSPCESVWYTGLWSQGHPIGSCASTLGVREVSIFSSPGCKNEPSHFGPGRLGNECDFFHFWSLHGGGANFLFADGGVRFLTYSVDSVMPALATRAGGETVGDF